MGYVVTSATTLNSDRSVTIANTAAYSDGSVAFERILNTLVSSSTVTNGGLTRTTTNLIDGNSAMAATTVDATVVSSGGTRTETVTNSAGTTVTSLMVEAAIRRALEAKHPLRDEPVHPRPSRRSSSRVQKIYNASGFTDVFVEGRAARLVRNQVRNVERSFSLVGYESTGSPINEDDDEADS